MTNRSALRNSLLACAALLLSTAASAQQPAAPLIYDVVSIHPNNSLSGSTRMSTTPGNLSFTNVTLKQLVSYAYGIREGLIEGLPNWAESAHYDMTAKVLDTDLAVIKNMPREQRGAMLIPVLADRFGLKVHNETRTLPVYELVVNKGGPKFQEYIAPAGTPDPKSPSAGSINSQNFNVTATGIPISSLAEWIAGRIDKTVLDKTGLLGKYSFELRYTPDNVRMNSAAAETTDQAPDIYTALQEQLGLKLVSSKGPVVTLIVDQIKQPTEN